MSHSTAMRWGVLFLALIWPTLLTVLYFVVLADAPGLLARGAYGFGKLLQFSLPLVGLALGFVAWFQWSVSWRWLLFVVSATLLVLVVLWGLYDQVLRTLLVTEHFMAAAAVRLAALGVAGRREFFGLAVGYSLVHSLLEEYYWRWFVYGGLREVASRWVSLLVSSVAFTLHHGVIVSALWGMSSPAPYLFTAGVLVGGLAWGWAYERDRSLTAVWASHALIDAFIFIVGFDLLNL